MFGHQGSRLSTYRLPRHPMIPDIPCEKAQQLPTPPPYTPEPSPKRTKTTKNRQRGIKCSNDALALNPLTSGGCIALWLREGCIERASLTHARPQEGVKLWTKPHFVHRIASSARPTGHVTLRARNDAQRIGSSPEAKRSLKIIRESWRASSGVRVIWTHSTCKLQGKRCHHDSSALGSSPTFSNDLKSASGKIHAVSLHAWEVRV